jgi:hypothetical protein
MRPSGEKNMGHDAISGIGSRPAEANIPIRRQAAAAEGTPGFSLPMADPLQQPLARDTVQTARKRTTDLAAVSVNLPGAAPRGHTAVPGSNPATAMALASYDGATWVGKLPGNGGRDVSILVPPGIDPQKPVEVLVLFPGVYRGHNAMQMALQDPYVNYREALNQMGHQRNTVIVMPSLAYDGHEMKANGSNDEDAGQLQQQAAAQIQKQWGLTAGPMTVVGYSYGGQPLMNAAESGKLQPGTRLIALDATYTWKSTGSIANRLGEAVRGQYPLHNFHHPARATQAVPADSGVNHLLTGEHGRLPRQLPILLARVY